jgi:hypothetical protein
MSSIMDVSKTWLGEQSRPRHGAERTLSQPRTRPRIRESTKLKPPQSQNNKRRVFLDRSTPLLAGGLEGGSSSTGEVGDHASGSTGRGQAPAGPRTGVLGK